MSAMQRTKGASGEREVSALIRDLTGWEVKRRVRNDHGDSDLIGIPGWSPEVKRHAKATRGDIAQWWAQAERQAQGLKPVLFYRLDRADWRAVWPLAAAIGGEWGGIEWTAETTVEAWAAVARSVDGNRSL